jgi:hypothetical protein
MSRVKQIISSKFTVATLRKLGTCPFVMEVVSPSQGDVLNHDCTHVGKEGTLGFGFRGLFRHSRRG